MAKGNRQPDATQGGKFQHAILVGVDGDGARRVAVLDLATGKRRDAGSLPKNTALGRFEMAAESVGRYLNNGRFDRGDETQLDDVGRTVNPNA